MDGVDLGLLEALQQLILAVVVEQESDRAPVHAVDRDAVVQVAVHGLEHLAVAAERNDDVGPLWRGLAIAGDKLAAGLVGFLHLAGDEGDVLEAGHGCVDGLGA